MQEYTYFLRNKSSSDIMDSGYFTEFIVLAAIVGGITAFMIVKRLRDE